MAEKKEPTPKTLAIVACLPNPAAKVFSSVGNITSQTPVEVPREEAQGYIDSGLCELADK